MTAPDVNDVRASERLREVIAFLMGNAPLDGCWFGEAPPAGRTAYWWRTQLSESYRAALADLSGEVRELVEDAGRAIAAWDSTTLPRVNDGMLQERMESLRAALAKFTQEKPNG